MRFNAIPLLSELIVSNLRPYLGLAEFEFEVELAKVAFKWQPSPPRLSPQAKKEDLSFSFEWRMAADGPWG